MRVTILTLFPEMFQSVFNFSIIKNARDKKLVDLQIIDIRDFGIGKHKVVDDTPYGGGHGMIMRVDVLYDAITYAKNTYPTKKFKRRVILLSTQGNTFTQQIAVKFAESFEHIILICGHYEGVDQRVTAYIDEELSIGDFVVTGGEIPAMIITDAVIRLVKNVLKPGVTDTESFSLTLTQDSSQRVLEYPHFTKPQTFDNVSVPDVLLTGNHKNIEKWRKLKSHEKTKKVRPDMLEKRL